MILVTGANGFIGSALTGELNQLGHKELVLSDLVTPQERPELLRGKSFQSFLSPEQVLESLQTSQLQPQWVLHMGACSDTTETRWDYLLKYNVHYTQSLFSWCAQNKVPLIYASSGAVYGDGSTSFRDDVTPLTHQPLNLYGQSKRDVDAWVLTQDQKPPSWYGLRFFNVYGPNEDFKEAMSSVVFKAYQQIKESGQLRLFKSAHPDYRDGEQMRDFVYVRDVVRWITELMEKKPTSGIYNMGTGKARTWLDLAAGCFAALDLPMKIDWIPLPKELASKYQYFTEADMSSWQREKLSPPEFSLESGTRDHLQNYLEKKRFL